jgi:hypothetical protein
VEVLHRAKEERNILHTMKRKKANQIRHISCRNYFLKHIVEGKIGGGIEVTERQVRRCKQLTDGFKETRRYRKLK